MFRTVKHCCHKQVISSTQSNRLLFQERPLRFSSIDHAHQLKPEYVLGKENREKCMDKLKTIKPIRVNEVQPLKKAAVFVPLCIINNEVSLLYTLRSTDLKNYRGQVSFPGGMEDKKDSSLEETAVRETYEELGIRKPSIDMWGHGNYIGTGRQEMVVLPFIGNIGAVDIKKLKLNPTEVESIFTVTLKHLCNPLSFRYTQFRNSYTLPVFIGAEQRIWGMTAIITHIILSALLPELYHNKLNILKSLQFTKKKQDM